MFSWICPKCGAEVPPSYSDCPNCSAPTARPAAPPPPARHAAPPPPPVPPRPAAPRPAASYQQQQQYSAPAPTPVEDPMEGRRPPKPAGVLFGSEPPLGQRMGAGPEYIPPSPAGYTPPGYPPPPAPSRGLPSWLLMLLVALAVGAVVSGAVWMKKRSGDSSEVAEKAAEAPATAASGSHRLAKYVEVAGFRLSEDAKRRTNVKMTIINHSAADLGDLTLEVTLKTPEGKVVGTADVKAPAIGPLGSADATAPLKTTERAYELPDWQFIRAEFQITSP